MGKKISLRGSSSPFFFNSLLSKIQCLFSFESMAALLFLTLPSRRKGEGKRKRRRLRREERYPVQLSVFYRSCQWFTFWERARGGADY